MGFNRDCLRTHHYHFRRNDEHQVTVFSRDQVPSPVTDDCPALIIGPNKAPIYTKSGTTNNPNHFRKLTSKDPLVKIIDNLRSRNIFIDGKVDAVHLQLLDRFISEFDYRSDQTIYLKDDFAEKVPELVRIERDRSDPVINLSFNQTTVVRAGKNLDDLEEVYTNELFKQLFHLLDADQLANWIAKKTTSTISVFPDENGFTRSELMKITAELIDLPKDLLAIAKLNHWMMFRESDLNRSKGNSEDITAMYDHGSGTVVLTGKSFARRDQLTKAVFHEIGHSVVKNLGEVYQDFIKLSWDGDKAKDNAKFVTAYAAESPEEDFCESFAHYIFNPDLLQKRCPEKYHFLKENVFGDIEYQDFTNPDFVFTLSLYKDENGNMIIDRDAPILDAPNNNLWMEISPPKKSAREKTKFKITFPAAKDERALGNATLWLKVDGLSGGFGDYADYQDGKFIFEFEHNLPNGLDSLHLDYIEVRDKAGNIARHFFPNRATIELDQNGKVNFVGNLDRMSSGEEKSLYRVKLDYHVLEAHQTTLVRRDDLAVEGSVYELILDGVDYQEGDYISMEWFDKYNVSKQDPVRHRFYHSKDGKGPTIRYDNQGRLRLLVHFHPYLPAGEYQLSSINIKRKSSGNKDTYLFRGGLFVTLQSDQIKNIEPIKPSEVRVLKKGYTQLGNKIYFELAIPYRDNISSVEAIVRYNDEETYPHGGGGRVKVIDGKKYLVYRMIINSESAEVEVKSLKVHYSHYKDPSFQSRFDKSRVDLDQLPPDSNPARASFTDPELSEINFSQRIIIPGVSLIKSE